MPKLVIQSGAQPNQEFVLREGINSVGRGEANDVCVPDPSVSTNHAEIIVDENGILLKDLGSTNGSFINQAQVTEIYLQPGQLLRLGNVELILENDLLVAIPEAALPPPIVPRAVATAPVRVSVPPPPAATETTQAPAGKTACKFHPKIAGEWFCRKCNELYCANCVTMRRTSEGMNVSCRKCGGGCVPVKVNFVAPKEKEVKVYSDGAIMVRCLGFGSVAALLSAALWTGLSWLFGFDILFIFFPMVAAICGYAVKLASQDRPGALFSAIAVVFFIIGSVLGKIGMIAATHLQLYTGTVLLTGLLGVLLGIYTAWKIGGGE